MPPPLARNAAASLCALAPRYANMGFIKRNKLCVCCRQVSWNNTMIMPGCPCCNKAKTLDIVAALRKRMGRRGTVGQIKKHEALVPQLEEALRAMDALAGKASASKGRDAPSSEVRAQVGRSSHSSLLHTPPRVVRLGSFVCRACAAAAGRCAGGLSWGRPTVCRGGSRQG